VQSAMLFGWELPRLHSSRQVRLTIDAGKTPGPISTCHFYGYKPCLCVDGFQLSLQAYSTLEA
jgi:hypothetical protein